VYLLRHGSAVVAPNRTTRVSEPVSCPCMDPSAAVLGGAGQRQQHVQQMFKSVRCLASNCYRSRRLKVNGGAA